MNALGVIGILGLCRRSPDPQEVNTEEFKRMTCLQLSTGSGEKIFYIHKKREK